jgi:hypothetical protein
MKSSNFRLYRHSNATTYCFIVYYWRNAEIRATFKIKELKSGLHLGQRQVTHDKERVTRSVSLSVLAYLLLVCLYGREEGSTKTWSFFKLKERFMGEVAHEARRRTELKWQRKFQQFKDVA